MGSFGTKVEAPVSRPDSSGCFGRQVSNADFVNEQHCQATVHIPPAADTTTESQPYHSEPTQLVNLSSFPVANPVGENPVAAAPPPAVPPSEQISVTGEDSPPKTGVCEPVETFSNAYQAMDVPDYWPGFDDNENTCFGALGDHSAVSQDQEEVTDPNHY